MNKGTNWKIGDCTWFYSVTYKIDSIFAMRHIFFKLMLIFILLAKSGSSSSSSSDTESLDNADSNSRNDQILCQKRLGETISGSLSKAVVVEVPKPLPETPTPESKVQLISKCPFGVFKSPIKPTKCF